MIQFEVSRGMAKVVCSSNANVCEWECRLLIKEIATKEYSVKESEYQARKWAEQVMNGF